MRKVIVDPRRPRARHVTAYFWLVRRGGTYQWSPTLNRSNERGRRCMYTKFDSTRVKVCRK